MLDTTHFLCYMSSRMVLNVSKVTKFCPFCRLQKVSETMKLVKNANKKDPASRSTVIQGRSNYLT